MISLQRSLKKSNDVAVLNESLTTESLAIAVNKENGNLLEVVNTIISDMEKSGKLDEITYKYFNDQFPELSKPSLMLFRML